MECSNALVNFQDDNTEEIVQIEDVLSFDADKDGGEWTASAYTRCDMGQAVTPTLMLPQ